MLANVPIYCGVNSSPKDVSDKRVFCNVISENYRYCICKQFANEDGK